MSASPGRRWCSASAAGLGLLQQALLQAWDRLDAETARADAAAGPGPAGVVDLLVDLSGEYTEDDFADQLLVLREDLRDPVLRARGEAWIDSLAGMIDRRLAGRAGDPPGPGRLVVAHWQGTLTVWSFTRPGPLSGHRSRRIDRPAGSRCATTRWRIDRAGSTRHDRS